MLFTDIKINLNKRNKKKLIIDLPYKNEIININEIQDKLLKPLVSYIMNINLYKSNIIVSINDNKGNIKYYFTSGMFGYKGSHKTKKYTLITILKTILSKIYCIYKKSIIINFKGVKRNQKIFIKKLKEKLLIKLIQHNDLIPHNGCRPKKIKRK